MLPLFLFFILVSVAYSALHPRVPLYLTGKTCMRLLKGIMCCPRTPTCASLIHNAFNATYAMIGSPLTPMSTQQRLKSGLFTASLVAKTWHSTSSMIGHFSLYSFIFIGSRLPFLSLYPSPDQSFTSLIDLIIPFLFFFLFFFFKILFLKKIICRSSGHATSPLTSAALAATASSTTTSPRAKNEHKPQHIITPLNKPGPTITHNNNNNNISPAKPISVHQQQPLPVASEPAQGIPAHSISHHNHHNHHHQNPSPSFHDLNPSNFAPSQESRRRNAEQRAATLRADGLIEKVEANRVYCSLCQKWVQLRQDSSYCAYPWLQHRVKCVARQ